MYGRWRTTEHAYVTALRRYATEIGNLAWCAPMDHMTEDAVLSRTGGTVRGHQQRTVTNYLRLREMAPELPIIPVLQGQSISDYHWCADSYERHGVDLATLPLVGVGSVCRRQHTAEVEQILRSLTARGYRLHAFGAKVLGLARFADAIASSDSAAWSFRGRYVPGCTPSHRSESNCQRFALAWHAALQQGLDAHHRGSRDHADTCPRELRRDTHTVGSSAVGGRSAQRRGSGRGPGHLTGTTSPPRRAPGPRSRGVTGRATKGQPTS